mgnify:CR=1 FL=1
MFNKLFKDKKARFVDITRFPSLPNVVFWFILINVFTFFVNFLLNQLFGFEFLKLGQPFRFLLLGIPVALIAYMIVQKKGQLERNDIFIIVLLFAGAIAGFIYLPKILPEVFSAVPLNSVWTEAADKIHKIVQPVIPIP